jgi:radical SAM protein with 4Fe4S-binding SPASM domain
MDQHILKSPVQVRVENTSLCNARCKICPREKLTRPMGTMSLEVFRSIVDQFDPSTLKDLHLQGFGEPLLDKHFVQKIRYAREKLPHTRLFFVTNASLLRGDLAGDIIQSGVDKIKVSFYGVSPAEYEDIHRGLKYERTRRNILDFIRLKKELRSRKPILSVKYIGPFRNYARFMIQWLGRTKVEFSHLHNYSTGRSYNPQRQHEKVLCPMISRPIMQILWNGDVVPCCYDFNGEFIIGNVLKDGVKAVWESERYNRLRQINRENKITSIPLCRNCDKVKHL